MITTVNLDNIKQVVTFEHTSKGNQPKWQANGKWYKTDHLGYESLSETIVSRLLVKSTTTDFVKYEPVLIQVGEKKIPGCQSNSFRKRNEVFIPFERLHRIYKGQGLASALAPFDVEEKLRYTVDFVEEVTHLNNVGEYITLLAEIDAFFLNEDRHTNNLAVIRNEKTGTYRLCPIFDNGMSLLADVNDYPIEADIYECMHRVRAKPFDMDFNTQLEAAETLYSSQLQFSFEMQDLLAVTADMRELYSEHIIDRVEKILREQIRKYPIFFSR